MEINPFELAWTKSRKSYCTTPGVGIGAGVGVSKKLNNKVFYVMGKALSGELSWPCDRSCYNTPLFLRVNKNSEAARLIFKNRLTRALDKREYLLIIRDNFC